MVSGSSGAGEAVGMRSGCCVLLVMPRTMTRPVPYVGDRAAAVPELESPAEPTGRQPSRTRSYDGGVPWTSWAC